MASQTPDPSVLGAGNSQTKTCHCGKEFTPKRRTQIHCSKKCKSEKLNRDHWKVFTAADGSKLILIVK